jgi:hypothetical protein
MRPGAARAGAMAEPEFTLGIEEEYFLVDRATREVVDDPPLDRGLVDFGRGAIFPYGALLDEIVALVEPDARHFGCLDEVAHARLILARGTSADRARSSQARAAAGATGGQAFGAVVDWLIVQKFLPLSAAHPHPLADARGLPHQGGGERSKNGQPPPRWGRSARSAGRG